MFCLPVIWHHRWQMQESQSRLSKLPCDVREEGDLQTQWEGKGAGFLNMFLLWQLKAFSVWVRRAVSSCWMNKNSSFLEEWEEQHPAFLSPQPFQTSHSSTWPCSLLSQEHPCTFHIKTLFTAVPPSAGDHQWLESIKYGCSNYFHYFECTAPTLSVILRDAGQWRWGVNGLWFDEMYFGGSPDCHCQPLELEKEFAEITALQMGVVGVLNLIWWLPNYLLGAVLLHSNSITAQEQFFF